MEEVKYLSSSLLDELGVKHGWFMKQGGVSAGLFQSLNGKKGSGDSDENVDENRRRALTSLCHPERSVAESSDLLTSHYQISRQARDDISLAHIVHEFKTNILEAKKPGEFESYDASFTTSPDVVLSQTTADCASVIIADASRKVVALAHGSWHTLKANIICDVVAKLKQHTGIGELVAGIGPMICKDCYEFGPEASYLFDAKYITPSGDKFLVDLQQMVIDQLSESGISKIDNLNICTKEDARFFSHRKYGANSGRMITLARLVKQQM